MAEDFKGKLENITMLIMETSTGRDIKAFIVTAGSKVVPILPACETDRNSC